MKPHALRSRASRLQASRIVLAVLSCRLVCALSAAAEDTNNPPDKDDYNLFNPTPDEYMRELSPDRPDKTECPYTVDAGHYQVEMDFANFTHDRTDGTTTRAWNVGPVNFKAGLLNHIDVQFVFDNYLHVRTANQAAGTTATQSGIGDFTTRLKVNLWGNDGGQTAFALLPYVTFPTSTDHLEDNAVEGGVILPLAVKLPADFEMTLETAASFTRNEDDSAYHEEFVASASVDHRLIGNLSGYMEFFSDFSTERHSTWVGTVDVGLEYAVTRNAQLDCGCNIGVTRAADDANIFAGITVRF